MGNPRWLFALPLALAMTWLPSAARASAVRDEAGLFGPEAVRKAEGALNQVERTHRITSTIETVDSLDGADVHDVALQHAERSGTRGLYILIAKKEHKIQLLASGRFGRALGQNREKAIRDAFTTAFKKGDYDAGLLAGAQAIDREVAAARAATQGAAPQGHRPGAPGGGGFGLGSLLGIGLLILAVLFGIRLLGALFGGGARGYAGPPGGGMGMGRPGFGGPGYGGPGYGYGGRGGGFLSSLFGGIGGAMAGNWLYDQFSGRHHGGNVDSASYGPSADPGAAADTGADDWASGTGVSGDWGDSGGGGGDWGGGGGGGGGDWGGGGGDWGGGGGGDGGGDW